MSKLTATGRRSLRDGLRNQVCWGLRTHPWFEGVPAPVVSGFIELVFISKELRAKIKEQGVMRVREDGTSELHPAVEAFRKFKGTELNYLTAIAEMRREQSPPEDLVAQLARAQSEEIVEPEPSAPDEGNPPESTSES